MNGSRFRAQTGVSTHEGQVRPFNEDSWFASDEMGLWAVADGMGGHERGEWASAIVVEELGKLVLASDFAVACGEIADALHRANRTIFTEATARGSQMGTTAVILFVRDGRFAILWVGDSRAYLLRGGQFVQLSRDHTQVQEMVDRGLLQPEEAEGHPMGHVLARAVGVVAELEVDVIQDEVEAGDTFLLCSDGLHGCVEETEIGRMLSGSVPEAIVSDLVNEALDHGAPDNVTTVAVRFGEPTLLAFA
jgi:serine/threonine protein phosphatase Stp1